MNVDVDGEVEDEESESEVKSVGDVSFLQDFLPCHSVTALQHCRDSNLQDEPQSGDNP